MTPKLSRNQWMALYAIYYDIDTDWIRPNTIESLFKLDLIQWIDNGGIGSYDTTSHGNEVCKELGSPYDIS